ncbi:MAG: hypothetical protein HC902_04970 [Calothrix sp. SM1_5_4]|nr:hypothetical protein [Calothrix sp. SM1_5_4]
MPWHFTCSFESLNETAERLGLNHAHLKEQVPMKRWIIAAALIAALPYAHAANNEKVEDLGIEAEAEEMSLFDQKKLEEQARKESAELEKQAKSLERQIQRMRSESESISKRIDSQSDRFDRMAKIARETESVAKKFEAQRNKLKARLDSLRARTQQAESRLQSARELQKTWIRTLNRRPRNNAILSAAKSKLKPAWTEPIKPSKDAR